MNKVLIREFLIFIGIISIMVFGNQMIFNDDSTQWRVSFSYSCLGIIWMTLIYYCTMLLIGLWGDDPKPLELVCKPFVIAAIGCSFSGIVMSWYLNLSGALG